MSEIIASFPPSRSTYIKEHIMLAALGAVILTAVLMFMGNPHYWTGALGSVLAIGARGSYAMKEQLGMVWQLTEDALITPDARKIPLASVKDARYLFSALQVITLTGEKYLIKYQPNPAEGAALILRVKGGGQA